MALEYELTFDTDAPVNQVAERALPDPAERPTGTAPLLSADLYDTHGFGVTILTGRNGYVEGQHDDGVLVWEPDQYASLTFRMDKFTDATWEVVNMLIVVRRTLDAGPENATLTLNGNTLLLARMDGTLTKHSRESWWVNYRGADDVIAG